MKINNNYGFSLIELLLVITMLSIVVVASTSLLFTTMSGSNKASGLAIVKQNGDHAISYIERQTREAESVECDTDPNPDELNLTDVDGNPITITTETATGRIVTIVPPDITYLTSDELLAENFTCEVDLGDPAVVQVNFRMTLAPGGIPSETATESFQTRVSLRTY